jgi:Cu-Zn family superoxide dismutase
MKLVKITALALILMASYNCKEAKKEANEAVPEMEEVKEEVEMISFKMEPKSDSGVSGEVTFVSENDRVSMVGTFSGLTPGEHAIHIHEKADCSAADGTSTGGHWNPTAEPHGKWGDEAGFHRGDIGNFTADANGDARVAFSTDLWCLDCDDENKNIVGKAVIVHQGLDDFTTQPTGAAGSRVSCTGIIN